MKIVPPSTFTDACTRIMDIESESKTSKARRHGSSSESEEDSKTIQALRKDLRRLMKEVARSKEEKKGETFGVQSVKKKAILRELARRKQFVRSARY